MAENSKIEWCDHTFNPWIGCTKVSPGCANCYADAQDKFRKWTPEGWGAGKPRKRTSAANWLLPLKWNIQAPLFMQCTQGCRFQSTEAGLEDFCPVCGDPQADTVRPRVFCASLADVFDPEVPSAWRRDLFFLITQCHHLDWLLLTKRPELVVGQLKEISHGPDARWDLWADWEQSNGLPNVWIGTTVEDQQRADERIPELLHIPARVRFLSCEPLLGPVDLMHVSTPRRQSDCCLGKDCGIDWVICGGESGPNARPMHPNWARGLRDQCQAAGVPFLFKQWGEWLPGCQYVEGDKERLHEKAQHTFDDDNHSWWVGKHAAGRQLAGREWNESPELDNLTSGGRER